MRHPCSTAPAAAAAAAGPCAAQHKLQWLPHMTSLTAGPVPSGPPCSPAAAGGPAAAAPAGLGAAGWLPGCCWPCAAVIAEGKAEHAGLRCGSRPTGDDMSLATHASDVSHTHIVRFIHVPDSYVVGPESATQSLPHLQLPQSVNASLRLPLASPQLQHLLLAAVCCGLRLCRCCSCQLQGLLELRAS